MGGGGGVNGKRKCPGLVGVVLGRRNGEEGEGEEEGGGGGGIGAAAAGGRRRVVLERGK